MVPLHAAVFIRDILPFTWKSLLTNSAFIFKRVMSHSFLSFFFNSHEHFSVFSFRQGPFVAMLIPKAHKIAVYSKLFNGEVSCCGCVSRCDLVQFFFPSGFVQCGKHPSRLLLLLRCNFEGVVYRFKTQELMAMV